jgi:hypothetical protein
LEIRIFLRPGKPVETVSAETALIHLPEQKHNQTAVQ